MAVYGVSQDLGAIDAEGIGPVLERGRVVIGDTKAEHRHTAEITVYYKGRGRFFWSRERGDARERTGDTSIAPTMAPASEICSRMLLPHRS